MQVETRDEGGEWDGYQIVQGFVGPTGRPDFTQVKCKATEEF